MNQKEIVPRAGSVRQALLAVLVGAAAIGGGVAVWWNWFRSPTSATLGGTAAAVEPPIKISVPIVRFKNVTQEAGIRFMHRNGGFGKKLLPETMGGGVAVFDF